MVAVLSILTTIAKGIQWLTSVANEDQKLGYNLKNGLGLLLFQVNSVEWDLRKYQGDPELTLRMEEMLLDIQDFICCLSIQPAAGMVAVATATDSRPKDIALIESFRARIRIIQGDQKKAIANGGGGGNSTIFSSSASSLDEDLDAGFPETKREFMELLSPVPGGKLRVVSIVGCNGVGKTALARAVYEAAHLHSSPPATEAEIGPIANKDELYEANAYHCKAWVVGPSTCQKPEHLLNQVLSKVDPTAAAGGETPEANLRKFLKDKRYLIIIDDLRATKFDWNRIQNAFPDNGNHSRIIVTTSVHSIARNYSSCSYQVFPMQCLGKANSEELFQKKFFGPHPHRPLSAPEMTCSRNILAKCDGLPLALISAGNYLCCIRKPHLSDPRHMEVCGELDNIVTSDKEAFDEMKRTFIQCYNSLEQYDHRNCLLYLSIFPRGHKINSKSFVRRLQAEQLVAGDVFLSLEKLIDESMIEAPIRNDCSVPKRCHVQGMMMEFIIHKSVSRNLVTLVDKGIVRKTDGQKKVRRLTVQSGSSIEEESSSAGVYGLNVQSGSGSSTEEESSSSGVYGLTIQSDSSIEEESSSSGACGLNVQSGSSTEEEGNRPSVHGLTFQSGSIRNDLLDADKIGELSSLRSLTMLKRMLLPDTWANFKNCEVMRVLDLEGCHGITKSSGVLDDICGFLFLKYLGLKNTDVDELPTKMKNLKHLETLDIRHTRVAILPVEVITLPELAHLFGEVELPLSGPGETEALTKFFVLNKKSKLETLVGIVIKDTRGFEIVTRHAEKLKKVKIYGSRMHTSPAASHPIPVNKSKSGFGNFFPKLRKTPVSKNELVEPNGLVGILVSSLHERTSTLESVSIDSSDISQAFLASVPKADSIITSMKLRGKLTSISKSRLLMGLCNLKKLHLFSTCLSSKELVEPLQILKCLQYLKLSEEDLPGSWDGDFCVTTGGFPALRELCFEGAKKCPRLVIVEEAMSILASLQLLCVQPPSLVGVEGLEHLKYLEEVILHHSADGVTVQAWKEAAKKHTNMPCVKKEPAQPISNAV